VLICEELLSLQEGLFLPLVVFGCRHDETCIQGSVWVLERVNVFDRADFLNGGGIQVENHTVSANRYLQQIVVELNVFANSLLDGLEVGFGDFGHLNVLQVTIVDHVIDR